MKTITLTCMLLLFCSCCFAQNAGTLSDCRKNATSQLALNRCAGEELAQADAELNRVYGRLLAKFKDVCAAVRNLRNAQRAWLACRDAKLQAVYPHADKLGEYGS